MAMSDPAEPGRRFDGTTEGVRRRGCAVRSVPCFGHAAMKIGTALTSLDGPYHTRQVTDAHWRRRPAESDANPPPPGPSNPSLIRHLRDSVLRRCIGDRESCNPFALSSEEAHRDIFRGVTMAKRRELLGMTVLAGAGLFSLWPRHRAAKAAQAAVFPVMHTDAEWRSLLGTRLPTSCCGGKVPRSRSPASSTSKRGRARMPVRAVICRSSRRKQNSIATRVGRASGSRCPMRLRRAATQASGWTAPRFIASAAADTLVMCFLTGRLPPVSVTA